MQNTIRRLMLSAAFAVGLAVPLATTWTSPAQALSSCSLLSGSDSWTGSVAGSGTFTVSVTYDTGVSVQGTPPPLSSLPMTLTSRSGHRLTITASSAGGHQYEGDFTSKIPVNCACAGNACNYTGTACETQDNMTCNLTANGCSSTVCGGSNCFGGECTTISTFKAAF